MDGTESPQISKEKFKNTVKWRKECVVSQVFAFHLNLRWRHNFTHVTKIANLKFNYQFMFSARLILGKKLDTSNFIYTTKKSKSNKKNPRKIPKQKKISEKRETLHRFLKKFRHTKFPFPFCSSNWRQLQSLLLLISFIMFLLSILLRFSYSEAWLFTRLFFGQFLFMSYQNPFWFLCTFLCGVLGNTQSVYYNLGTVRVKENINIVAELSATHYAIFTDLYFY